MADAAWARRSGWAALGGSALLVLLAARVLTPDPSGLGTHVQLGLPPCLFHAWTAMRCPACGLTTSFAYMARFDVAAAAFAHPIGVPLFLVTLAAVPLAGVGGFRAWPVAPTLRAIRAREGALVLGVALLVAWVARVAVVGRG